MCLTTEGLAPFVGGQMDIKENFTNGPWLRGEIETIRAVSKEGRSILRITFVWLAVRCRGKWVATHPVIDEVDLSRFEIEENNGGDISHISLFGREEAGCEETIHLFLPGLPDENRLDRSIVWGLPPV